MTRFSPLEWVASTITAWHLAAWAVFFVLSVWLTPRGKKAMPKPLRIWGGIIMLPLVYCMGALVIGQLFGDRFSWSQIWPSGLMTGVVVSTFFVVEIVPAVWRGAGRRMELSVLGIVAVPLVTVFFGLFFSVVWWVFPRIIGFGLFDLPKQSWGVQL